MIRLSCVACNSARRWVQIQGKQIGDFLMFTHSSSYAQMKLFKQIFKSSGVERQY